jgi:hypothetical protein
MLTDAGAGGQRSVQPVEANFFDFDPAIAHRLKAALLEGLAMAIASSRAKLRWRGRGVNSETRKRMADYLLGGYRQGGSQS